MTRFDRGYQIIPALLFMVVAGLTATIGWAGEIDFAPTTFRILDPATGKLIGNVSFRISRSADGAVHVKSDALYLDGDFDSEQDYLVPGDGGLLQQVSFSHSFYHPDGTPDRSSQANFRTGHASCTTNLNGQAKIESADFRFGNDTYAGAPIVIPLRDALMSNAGQKLEFHYFTCLPGPRVVSVRALPYPPARWSYAQVPVVKVDLQPDFGWINAIIAPFLPDVAAWFEPSRQWYLAGVTSARYYKGANILMVAGSSGPSDNHGKIRAMDSFR